jgi:hypothetical protein
MEEDGSTAIGWCNATSPHGSTNNHHNQPRDDNDDDGQQSMSMEQQAWAGIARVLRKSDDSIAGSSVASSTQVLPRHIMNALRKMKRNGSVASCAHVPTFGLDDGKDDYLDDDDDDDEESCMADSILSSAMPSLCSASLASVATGIITAYPAEVAHFIVQTRPRNDTLQAFCNHLLSTAGDDKPIPTFGLSNDDDNDEGDESKSTESLHSSMPSLCNASFSSVATGFVTPNDAANNIVQPRSRSDTLLYDFCNHLLKAVVNHYDDADLPGESATPDRDQQRSRPTNRSPVRPRLNLSTLRGSKWSGSIASSNVQHHIPTFGLDNRNDDYDDDGDNDESKTADSIKSTSMPSLCTASLASFASEIITASVNEVAQCVVQSRPREEPLKVFCSHLLSAINPPTDVAESIGESGEEPIDEQEMVACLLRLLTSASDKKEDADMSAEKSLEDSMPSLLDCISTTDTIDGNVLLLSERHAASSCDRMPRKHNDELNNSMPSLLSTRTGDLDLYTSCATKWASCGDLNHISEHDEAASSSSSSSTSNVSADEESDDAESEPDESSSSPSCVSDDDEEESDDDSTASGDNEVEPVIIPEPQPIPKSPMRRARTTDGVSPVPPLVKPMIRRAKTESCHVTTNDRADIVDRNATPDTMFADFIPTSAHDDEDDDGPPSVASRLSPTRKSSFMSIFPSRGLSNQSFRQRVSKLSFRSGGGGGPESPSKACAKVKTGRSEARFFPSDDTIEDGGEMLLP